MSDREKLIELLNNAGEMLAVDEAVAAELSGCENGWIKDKIGFIADYIISNGVTVQKWIPVSERLPTEEDANPYESVLAINKDDGFPRSWIWDIVEHYPTEFTYWMPLPEPPKECE